jgi:hypothetical protein
MSGITAGLDAAAPSDADLRLEHVFARLLKPQRQALRWSLSDPALMVYLSSGHRVVCQHSGRHAGKERR